MLQRSINQMLVQQRLLKFVAQHEKIIHNAAEVVGMSEERVIEVVKGMKHRDLCNPNHALREILKAIAKDDNTRDILSDYEKLRKYNGRLRK